MTRIEDILDLPLKPHETRVVHEYHALAEKFNALHKFIQTPMLGMLDELEQYDLVKQHEIMRDYLSVLGRRIRRFANKYGIYEAEV
jgi:hypothetical protein